MPAPRALQPTKTREPFSRERMLGWRGRHGGLTCDPIPRRSGERLSPAQASTPQVSPVPLCVFSRGARAGPRRPPRMRSGPDAGGDCPLTGKGQGKRVSVREGQLWSANARQQPSKRALMPLRGPVRRYHPREDGCATGSGKDPRGSGRSGAGLCLRLPGTAVWRGPNVLFL